MYRIELPGIVITCDTAGEALAVVRDLLGTSATVPATTPKKRPVPVAAFDDETPIGAQ